MYVRPQSSEWFDYPGRFFFEEVRLISLHSSGLALQQNHVRSAETVNSGDKGVTLVITPMDITHMLSELRTELQQLDEAILVLQRLASSGAKRRGRPPKWMTQTHQDEPASSAPSRKRKPFSAATRKKTAAAQKKRWAEKKAKAA